MANFSVHLYGAAAVSSAASLGVYGLGWAGPELTQVLFFLGVAGGLLPDIDADGSAPVRGFFTLFGVVVGFLASFTLVGQLAVVDLTLVWIGVFLLVRYGVFEAFARFTVHRGIWHSWLALIRKELQLAPPSVINTFPNAVIPGSIRDESGKFCILGAPGWPLTNRKDG
jgi:hypothetical protein